MPDDIGDEADEAGPASGAGGPGAVRGQNRIALIGTVLLIALLAIGGGIVIGRGTAPAGSAAPSGDASAAAGVPTTIPAASTGIESDGARLGRADAKVVIDYWADYQCPFCSKFAREVIPQLQSRLADGTVALVHRDFAFIGPESVAASAAVRCAAPEGKYWQMHDAVYAAQNGENQGAFAADRLKTIAASVGLDEARWTACVNDHATLVGILDDTAAGVRAGIESTPTIDVNGNRFLGVPDVAKFLATIDAAAAGAAPGALPSAKPVGDPWAGTPTSGREAGSSSAPVTVELWMDYQAATSGSVANSLEPELRKRVTDGTARLVLRDLALLGDESLSAAAAVRCVADQGGPAWLMHDVLAVNAQGAGSGIYVTDTLLRVASQLGLDVRAFDACLADPSIAKAIKDETAQGSALGLTAGPAIIVRKSDQEAARFSGEIDTAKVLAAIDGK